METVESVAINSTQLLDLSFMEDLVNSEVINYLARIKNYEVQSYQDVMNEYKDFLDEILSYHLPLIILPDTLVKMTTKIFSSGLQTDLLMRVGSSIITKLNFLGEINNIGYYNAFINSLILMYNPTGNIESTENCLAPDDIKQSLSTDTNTLMALFQANSWLITVILINLFYQPVLLNEVFKS